MDPMKNKVAAGRRASGQAGRSKQSSLADADGADKHMGNDHSETCKDGTKGSTTLLIATRAN